MQIISAFELSFKCNIVLGLILFIRSQFQYVLCSRLNVMRFFCGVWSVKKTLANNVVKDKYQCRSLFSFHISLLTSSITEIHKAQTLNIKSLGRGQWTIKCTNRTGAWCPPRRPRAAAPCHLRTNCARKVQGETAAAAAPGARGSCRGHPSASPLHHLISQEKNPWWRSCQGGFLSSCFLRSLSLKFGKNI